jgi:hypothetical protein
MDTRGRMCANTCIHTGALPQRDSRRSFRSSFFPSTAADARRRRHRERTKSNNQLCAFRRYRTVTTEEVDDRFLSFSDAPVRACERKRGEKKNSTYDLLMLRRRMVMGRRRRRSARRRIRLIHGPSWHLSLLRSWSLRWSIVEITKTHHRIHDHRLGTISRVRI